MKQWKWIIISIFTVFMVILGYQVLKPKPFTEVEVQAKIDGYSSGEELEKASNVIVIGQLERSGKSQVEHDNDGSVIGAYTISDFKISQVLKNETQEKLTKGRIIPIYENEGHDTKNNKTYHIAGYTKMEKDETYMLLFQKDADVSYYTPTAAIFGKINLDSNKRNELYPKNSEIEREINEVQAEVLTNHKSKIQKE
ncbi:hypothetical protein LAX74_003720 [Listeria marthii]|nr:hypothetical protein [Listeria marthii]UHP13743.1 hypothetical protein LAX74_003720 [Listeria marthii]